MKKVMLALVAGLCAVACSGGISSYEDGMDAQLVVLNEMIDVLADVEDEASAKAAVEDLEALGGRLAEIAKALAELPQPDADELQALAEKREPSDRAFQEKASSEMAKLGQYPELGKAFTDALSKGE